jgi:hypothetical protein
VGIALLEFSSIVRFLIWFVGHVKPPLEKSPHA